MKKSIAYVFLPVLVLLFIAADWADWRGPTRDGVSPEKSLPERWSPSGDNLLFRAPYGGRSTPIVMGDHIYLLNGVGKGATLQERVLCLNADDGKLLWEHRFNVYLSDVPPHRVGWASPAADPSTANVYAFGVGGVLLALSRDGKLLWERSLGEDFGLVTTHGGRTVSPIIEGDWVIVSGVTSAWGDQARAAQRFMAFDKTTGLTAWVSSPGGRPYDTTYSPPVVADINGAQLFIAGGSDGAFHALKAATGEPVWKYEVSKRGLNTGVVLKGTTALVSHSEENVDTNDMGLLAAIDATAKGAIGKEQIVWKVTGFQGGYSSPVIDSERLYQVDNGSNLFAFDLKDGRQLWVQNLGTIQKASPVLADGKLYVGTENGKFFIVRPGPTGAQVLDEDQLGSEGAPEAIIGSVAVSDGRIYLPTSEALYCIGKRSGPRAGTPPTARALPPPGSPTHLQVVPTEILLSPGESVSFQARLYDEHGRLVGPASSVSWSLAQVQGTLGDDGRFTAASDLVARAGQVKATSGTLSGTARLRVIPPLPWTDSFDSGAVPAHWVNATGKFTVRDLEGNKVLVKLADNPFTKRARVFMGHATWSNYTVSLDGRATESRRQMGDFGVVAQRYSLVLSGSHQRLELQTWQPETERTAATAFPWKANTWYRMKLEVQNLPNGKTRARGKAWPVAEPEPAEWLLEKIDSIPNRQGSPGIYADAPFEVFLDNLKVTANP